MSLHLNHFYLNPCEYYPCISHPVVSMYRRLDSLSDSPHILLYGSDFGLNRFYANQILKWNFSTLHTKKVLVNINNVDVEYAVNSHFIEINFNTHLNKEKGALVDLIKNVTSTKNVFSKKHIIMLYNIDLLNNQMQCKLRRIVETSDLNATFIAVCSRLSKLIDPVISRFFPLRVPMLDTNQKTKLMTKCILANNDEGDYSSTVTSCIKNNYVSTFQDIVMCSIICVLNDEKVIKKIKTYQFVKSEIESLFKSFPGYKNVFKATDSIRTSVYKLVHYNLPHIEVAKLVIDVTASKKAIFANKMLEISRIVAKFDENMIHVNQCKIIHVYEEMLFNIFTLTL